MPKNTRALILILLVMTIASGWYVAGCGGGGGGETPQPSPTESIKPTETPPVTPTTTPKIKAYIEVKSDPTGAIIYLNGNETGKITNDTLEVDPGTYLIRIELTNYIPYEETLTVAENETKIINATLVHETWTWEKDPNFGTNGEVDLSSYGQPRHPLVENGIVNVPIGTNVVRFNSTTGAYVDTINVATTTITVSVDKDNNHIVNLPSSSMGVYDTNWQNLVTYSILTSGPNDHMCKKESNEIYFLSSDGMTNTWVYIYNTLNGSHIVTLDIDALNPENVYSNAQSVAVDASGNILIAYRDSDCVAKYNSSGQQIGYVNSYGGINFNSPDGIDVNSAGIVAITDRLNSRVVIFDSLFDEKGTYAESDFFPGGVVIDNTNDIFWTGYLSEKLGKLKKQ